MIQISSNTSHSILKSLRINNIILCTHSRCNFKCSFCPYPVYGKNHQMTSDLVFKLIETIGQYPEIEKVYLDDVNEPLLDPNCLDYVKALQTKGKKVALATNGFLLSRQKLRDSLKKNMPDEFIISVHTHTSEDFVKTRGTKVKFDEYINAVTNGIGELHPFMDSDKFIRVEVAIHPAHRWRNRILGLQIGETSFYPDVDNLCEGVGRFLKLLNERISFQKQLVEKIVLQNIRLARRGKEHLDQVPVTDNLFVNLKIFEDWRNYWHLKKNFFARCHPTHLVIRANGDLTRCCIDHRAETKMGNVFETPFQEILESNYEIIYKGITGRPFYDVCLKCQGQPTYRGALIHNVYCGIRNVAWRRQGKIPGCISCEA